MTPDMVRRFLDWLAREIAEALAGEQAEPITEQETAEPRADGQTTTSGLVTPRQSNLNARPATPLATTRIDRPVALGDTNRGRPVTPPPDDVVIPVKALPPPAFAALATLPQMVRIWNTPDDWLTWTENWLFAKALAPAGSDPIADYPVEDDVREKLWRRVGKRGSPYPAPGEWEFVTREYPSERHPYQSGWDGEPYVAGIVTQDWRHLAVADGGTVPLPVNAGKLHMPDGIGTTWLGTPLTLVANFTIVGPRFSIQDLSDDSVTTEEAYANVQNELYSEESDDALGTPTTFEQEVRRWYRNRSEQITSIDGQAVPGTVTFERREREFTGGGVVSETPSGTIVFPAGSRFANAQPAFPPFWDEPLFAPAQVDGDHTDTDTIKIAVSDPAWQTFLEENRTAVRFFMDGQAPHETVLDVVEVIDDATGVYLVLPQPITTFNGANVQRYALAFPRSGSDRTYFFRDEIDMTWSRNTFLQTHYLLNNDSTLAYRVTAGRSTQTTRRLRVYEGSDATGTLLLDYDKTGDTAYDFGSLTTEADTFYTATFASSDGGGILTGGLQWLLRVDGTAPLGGLLEGATFRRTTTGSAFGGGTQDFHVYTFDGPIVVKNYKPHPEDPPAGYPASQDYLYATVLPARFAHEDREPYWTYAREVNPLIYEGELGTLHNPMAWNDPAPAGSTWAGITITSRWYAADAFNIDGRLVAIVIEEDDWRTTISIDSSIAWQGSLWDLLAACTDEITFSHRDDTAPLVWPNDRNPVFQVAPHYNWLHPDWPFPMGTVGPFSFRIRLDRADQPGVAWEGDAAVPPVVLYPLA